MLKMCQERCEDEDVEQNGPSSYQHKLAIGLNWERLTRLLDGKRIDMYVVVVVVHEHVWRTVCSVCATGARVA